MELDGDFSLLSASQKLFILPKMPSGVEKEDFTRRVVHGSCEKASLLIFSCYATGSGSWFHQLEMEGGNGVSLAARLGPTPPPAKITFVLISQPGQISSRPYAGTECALLKSETEG